MRINLTGGSLQPHTPLLSAQRCLNLYPEPLNPDSGEPVQWACYPRGGLKPVYTSQNNFNRPVRGMYKTSQGELIICIGTEVIRLNEDLTFDLIGNIQDGTTQVRMMDNTLVLFHTLPSVLLAFCYLPARARSSQTQPTSNAV